MNVWNAPGAVARNKAGIGWTVGILMVACLVFANIWHSTDHYKIKKPMVQFTVGQKVHVNSSGVDVTDDSTGYMSATQNGWDIYVRDDNGRVVKGWVSKGQTEFALTDGDPYVEQDCQDHNMLMGWDWNSCDDFEYGGGSDEYESDITVYLPEDQLEDVLAK